MDLTNLKWTKNVKHPNGKSWAYDSFKGGNLFKLNWKDDTNNANKPDKNNLILLRQKGYVTHLVKVLDYRHEREDWEGNYNIYRIVEVFWVIDFNELCPRASSDNVLGYPEARNYQGGNIMKLETLPTFKEYWDINGGLDSFRDHVNQMLNLP
jgi:hypothetical protein